MYGCLKELARSNRRNPTEAESVLWNMVKGCGLGQKFQRQHVIGCFIADFVCLASHLIIELDGGYHSLPEQRLSDGDRTDWLERQGFRVVRFTNEEVICDTENVLRQIKENLR